MALLVLGRAGLARELAQDPAGATALTDSARIPARTRVEQPFKAWSDGRAGIDPRCNILSMGAHDGILSNVSFLMITAEMQEALSEVVSHALPPEAPNGARL